MTLWTITTCWALSLRPTRTRSGRRTTRSQERTTQTKSAMTQTQVCAQCLGGWVGVGRCVRACSTTVVGRVRGVRVHAGAWLHGGHWRVFIAGLALRATVTTKNPLGLCLSPGLLAVAPSMCSAASSPSTRCTTAVCVWGCWGASAAWLRMCSPLASHIFRAPVRPHSLRSQFADAGSSLEDPCGFNHMAMHWLVARTA